MQAGWPIVEPELVGATADEAKRPLDNRTPTRPIAEIGPMPIKEGQCRPEHSVRSLFIASGRTDGGHDSFRSQMKPS
jgi:hypothetical protein